jgi:hypothetical protein
MLAEEEGELMGSLVTASCDCGYSVSLQLGGGMANFEALCLFPVYCHACHALVEANVLDSPIICPGCGGSDVVAYDAPDLIGEPGKQEVFSWHIRGRSLYLSSGCYLCPECQQMRLRFEDAGCWD